MMSFFRTRLWPFLLAALAAPIDFAVGGQAVIEGVMMRSPNFYTVTVRDRSGALCMKQTPFTPLIQRVRLAGLAILNIPLLRGSIQLVESMILGIRSLDYASAVYEAEGAFVEKVAQEEAPQALWKRVLFGLGAALYFVFILGLPLVLFKVLPLWVATQVANWLPVVHANYVLFNLVDGVTKMVIFLAYLQLLSLLPDIRRVFQYHGAEHQSIWTYEKKLPLTVEHARAQTRFHPRCGTSFLFLVIVLSVLVYTVVPPAGSFAGLLAERIAVIPLIAGLGYEVLKLSARHSNSLWARAVAMPGLFFQRFTTRVPDDAQLEVALHSLKASLAAEKLPPLSDF